MLIRLLVCLLMGAFSLLGTSEPPLSIIGCGYVGLTLAGTLAQQGKSIICVDIDSEKIASLQRQHIPICEPGLEALLFSSDVKIQFTHSFELTHASALYFICVPTPTDDEGNCIFDYLYNAFDAVVRHCMDGSIIIIKSTVPPGTIRALHSRLPSDKKITLLYNPEFMREGSALRDIQTNPIVIGTDREDKGLITQLLYTLIPNPFGQMIVTNWESAELFKYAWNSFSALRITFVNELSFLCKEYEADIQTIIQGIALSQKLLPTEKLMPGPGLGGSCLPKDIASCARIFQKHGVPHSLIHQTMTSNDAHKKRIINQILNQNPHTVTLLGLAFKAHTNDIRNAPAIDIITALTQAGITIKAYDPHAMPNMKERFPFITYCSNPYEASYETDMIVILTEWEEIKNLDFEKLAPLCNKKSILDTRYLFDAQNVRSYGFTYHT